MAEFIKKHIRYSWVLVGGIVGYSYYYFIGCNNGCAIQSNPYFSTVYGAFFAYVLVMPGKKKKEEKADN